MIQLLSKLRFLSQQEEKTIKVIGSLEPDCQIALECWGICLQKVLVKNGPWGSFILKAAGQEIALSPMLAEQLQVIDLETIAVQVA